jgi:DNA replication and repair protein RecF
VSLRITRLQLSDFRSYSSFELCPDQKLTILVGPNAAGKTNIVEAIELVTAAESFRKPSWGDVVRWGTDEARLEMQAEGDGRVLNIVMHATPAGRRSYQVNGKIRRRLSEVAGILPCVVFTPDDLRMVKESAERRRSAVDGVGDQLSPAYRSARLNYERILKHRNSLLREESADPSMIDVWTRQLVESGVTFGGHRMRLFDRLAEKMSEVYRILSDGESLQSHYVASWRLDSHAGSDLKEEMSEALRRHAREERARGTTVIGPHRDEITFEINGRDARAFASQGQQRTIALAWKLGEVGVIAEISGQPPVLLLDDVMSELDASRRHALTRFVGDAAQTFMTTTNLGYFDPDLVSRAQVVDLG